MPVISFVSSKGGVGKTTSAVLLASVIAESGASVALLDADPNQPIATWRAGEGPFPKTLTVIPRISEQNILETIEEQSAVNQFVVVDLEGSANIALSYAMGQSDLVVIPLQASQLDADEASKTIKLIQRQRKTTNRDIDCVVVWQRSNAAFITNTAKHLAQEFEGAGIPILPTKIVDREAYRAIFSFGTSLMGLDEKKVSGLAKARHNASAFANEIVSRYMNRKAQHEHAA